MSLPGDKVTASDFNALVDKYQKYWSDIFPSSAFNALDKSNHCYGWGQNTVEPTKAIGDIVEAEDMNRLIAQVNAGLIHMDTTNQLFPMLAPGTPILAENLTVIDNLCPYFESNKFKLDPTMADKLIDDTYDMTVPVQWNETLAIKTTAKWDTYADARYFFNSGGQIVLDPYVASGNATLAYWQEWQDALSIIGEIRIGARRTVVDGAVIGTDDGGLDGVIDIEAGFYDLLDVYTPGLDNDPNGKFYDANGEIVLWEGSPPADNYGGAYGAYGAYGGPAYGGYGGYGGRYVTVTGKLVENPDNSLDVIITVRLTDLTTPAGFYIALDIAMDVGYNNAADAPGTPQPPVVTASYTYKFEERQAPTFSIHTNWTGN